MFVRQPLIENVKGGLRVAHRELYNQAHLNNNDRAIPVTPFVGAFLRNFATNYQNYRVEKFEVIYSPSAPTDSGGKILMAPSYSSFNPIRKEVAGDKKSIWDLSQMDGATSFAAWAEGACGWLASKAARQTFRVLGIVGEPTDLNAGNLAADSDEASIPGYVIISPNDVSGDPEGGDLWIDYSFIFSGPVAQSLTTTYYSASTDDSALALHNGKVLGWSGGFHVNGNRITFNYPGNYTLIFKFEGDTIVLDQDGHAFHDQNGTSVIGSRLAAAYDLSDAGFDTSLNSSDHNLWVSGASTAGAMQVVCFTGVKPGDYMDIDTFTSKTSLSSTLIHIIPTGPNIVLRP
jgi:hypothetical protein